MNPPLDQLTSDGYDLQWGTNVLGHFYLTELLLPALAAGARSSADQHARVITTSSSGAYMGDIVEGAFRDSATRRNMHPEQLYFNSKLVREPFSLRADVGNRLTGPRAARNREMSSSRARRRYGTRTRASFPSL